MLVFVAVSIALLIGLTLGFGLMLISLRFRNDSKERRFTAIEQRWEPEILRLLAGDVTANELHSQVTPPQERHLVDVALRFATRLSGDDRERVEEFARLLVPSILVELTARQPETRARALRTLSVLAFDGYQERIAAALNDKSPLVAMVAARALAQQAGPAHIGAILGELHRFAVWSPAFLASMVASAEPAAVATLRSSLADGRQPPATRSVVADGLRLLRDPAAGEVAAAVLVATQDRELAAACLRMLKEVGTSAHIGIIGDLLASTDFVLRATAASAMGSLAGRDEITTVARLLDDESPWVAPHAARALKKGGRRDVLEALAAGARCPSRRGG